MTVSAVQRVSVPVSDPQRARDFYQEVLGFELRGDHPVPMGEGARWIELGPRGGGPGIVLVTWLPEMAPGALQGLMLATEDVGALCTRIAAAGFEVEGPFDTPWGQQASLADPDGNGLVLTGPELANA